MKLTDFKREYNLIGSLLVKIIIARGISLANDICKRYRREGLFFDAVLDKAKIGGK